MRRAVSLDVVVGVLVLARLATDGLVGLDVLLLFWERLLGAILILHDDPPFGLFEVFGN